MVDLARDEATRAIQTSESPGFKPRVPVPAAPIADAAKRDEWIERKGMTVFSLRRRRSASHASDLNTNTFSDGATLSRIDFG